MSTKRGNPSELAARCVEKALGRGASAADALRTAAPFPPMDAGIRCLAGHQIRATFTNPKGN